MEVRLGNKTYKIPEKWIGRWDLLSNYREDAGSDSMEIPASAGMNSQHIMNWILLNKRMDNKHKPDNKFNLSYVIRPIRYFLPSTAEYILYIDFSSVEGIQRVSLIRELGTWYRDKIVHVQSARNRSLPIVTEDPYYYLCQLYDISYEDREVIDGLIYLSKKIPIDFLYGLRRLTDDWVLMLWEDAYMGHELLKKEWHEACVAFLSYFITHKKSIMKATGRQYAKIREAVAKLPVLVPSNLVRIFTNRELIEPTRPSLSLERLLDSVSDVRTEEIENSLVEYEQTRVMPDLFRYKLYEVGIDHLPSDDSRLVLRDVLSQDPHRTSSPYVEVKASIPNVDAYYSILYDYAEEHPSWKTFRVIFGGIAHLGQVPGNAREESLSSIPSLLALIRPNGYSISAVSKNMASRILQTLGSRCLMAMSACIIGAAEQETLTDYFSKELTVDERRLAMEIETTREYTIALCEQALEVIDENSDIGGVKWPIIRGY